MSSLATSVSQRSGDGASSVGTSTVEELNESDVLEAIEMMPSSVSKMNFLQIIDKCPQVVVKETHPFRFLRCEANDPKAAARRLLNYWDLRKRIFGPDRAFKTMDATGRGALEADQSFSSSTRYLRILPNDLLGRPVILFDRSCMNTVKSFEEEARLWFYAFAVISENTAAQEKGAVFLALYKPLTFLTSSSETVQSILAHLRESMPVANIDSIVVSMQPPYENVDTNMLSLFLNQIGGARTCFGTTPQEVAKKLVVAGLRMEGIPVELGGEWRFEDDDRRQFQRDLLEVSRYLNAAASSESSSTTTTTTEISTGKSGAPQVVLRSLFAMPAADISALLEAARKDPDNVVQETSFARYLVHYKGNEVVAARKIATYWKLKKAVCGDKFAMTWVATSPACQKCAVSLHETSNGLGNGFIVRLPKADPQGQDAFYIKDACLAHCPNWQRGLFYALSVMDSTRTSDGGSLCVFVEATHPQWYQICVEALFQFSESAFPLRISKVHLMVESGSNLAQLHALHQKWVLDLEKRLNQGAGQEEESRLTLSDKIVFDCSSVSVRMMTLSKAGYKMDDLEGLFQSSSTGKDHSHIWFGGSPAAEGHAATASEPSNAPFSAIQPPTPDLEHHWLRLMDDAVAQLPQAERCSYLRAKHEAPQIVEKESNPLLFLRFEQFNTWAAAKRLCYYWTERCKAFKEMAYCPMNQTGEGALTRQDVEVLSSGYIASLPHDNEGRTVLFQDASRLTEHDHATLTRLIFYWYHIVTQQKDVVTKGFVLICYLNQVTVSMVGKRLRQRLEMSKKAFPFHRHSLHIIPKVQDRSVMDEIVPSLFSLFSNKVGSNYCHRCNDHAELIKKLSEHGLSKEGLPTTIGGGWSYEHFINWQERQMRIEWELPLGALDKSEDMNYIVKPISELADGERKERKRRYNILHSRRKRRRDKMESEGFRQQIRALEEEKKGILRERDRLQTLLFRANQVVANQSTVP